MASNFDLQSIVSLTSRLVRCPTALDSFDGLDKIVATLVDWHKDHGQDLLILRNEAGEIVALYAETGSSDLPLLCLNACADTAPAGDVSQWKTDPFDAIESDGRLYGRGTADSKIAVSIFSHIFAQEAAVSAGRKARLGVLFDLDEHSGKFGGVKALIKRETNFLGMFIGYPGNESINIGARGFYRLKIRIKGKAQHSGSSAPISLNAVSIAAELVKSLNSKDFSTENSDDFPMGGRITVTDICGSGQFTTVPGMAEIGIDCRLTPEFSKADAKRAIDQTIEFTKALFEGKPSFEIEEIESWPPYKIDGNHEIVDALSNAASQFFDHPISVRAVGPSNIGNLLAQYDCPAICGFGVNYGASHAPNEFIELSSVKPVYLAYREAIRHLCLSANVKSERQAVVT